MNKNLLYIAGCGLLAHSLSTHAAALPAKNKAQQGKNSPNVVFILADDLAYWDIEAFGQKIVKTPNLNRMKEQGVRFMNFYGSSPVSAPCRASLMTGQHSGFTKIRDNGEIQNNTTDIDGDGIVDTRDGQMALDKSVKTLPQLFKSAGYATGAFGKWGMGGASSDTKPNEVGFDTFYGYLDQFLAHTYYPKYLWNNTTVERFNNDYQNNIRNVYSGDTIQKHALKFIRDNKDKPFFGYFAYTLPHAGAEQPADSLVMMYRGRIVEDKKFAGSDPSFYAATEEPRAQYSAMISRLDAYVGQILDELETQGILDNTLVIFTSDNGPSTEGGRDVDFCNTEKLFKGYKRQLYEGGIHVPFLAMWPGKIAPNSESNLHSAMYDVMATCTELVGKQKEWSQPTQGLSFLPTLTGKDKKQEKHAHLYWEFSGMQAVRKGKWKLIRFGCSNPATQRFELYDMELDRGETTNLADRNPDVVKELYEVMKTDRSTPIPKFNSIKFVD